MSVLIAGWETADSSHRLGTDIHLRLRNFVQQLPSDTEPAQLKTLIAPILAHDKEQQNNFYEIFDKSLAGFSQNFPEEFFQNNFPEKKFEKNISQENISGNIFEKKIQEKKFSKIILGIGAFVLILILFFFGKFFYENYYHKKFEVGIKVPYQEFKAVNVTVNMLNSREQSVSFADCEDSIPIKNVTRVSQKPLVHTRLRLPEEDLNKKEGGENKRAQNERDRLLCYFVPISKGNDTVFFRFNLVNDSVHLHAYIFQSDTFYIDQFAKHDAVDTLPVKPYQHHPDISSLIPKETWHFGWSYARWRLWKWLTVLMAAILIFGATYLYRRSQEKLILKHIPNNKPPYLWSLKIPNVQGVTFNENFYKIISELRQRGNTDVQQIDMARTVNATIKNAGHITLQYRAQTLPNEYLLLIDMHLPQNHRAQLFNLLYHAFDDSEVLVERFYYDGDLRLFWNEKFRRGIVLNALQSAYPHHRLIIFGSAVSLLSPINGKFSRWANVFDAWRTRALLTPRPVNDWDTREAQLATKFRLLPSTLQGIGDLVENLEAIEPKDYRLWKKLGDRHADALPITPDLPNDALLVLLESAYVTYINGKRDDTMLQWIAACAVSPILHWDWTLHIAHIIDKGSKNLLSLENLFQINRLPWFIDGKMPGSVRLTLLDWLEKNHPETLIAVRKEWQQVLESEQNTPPPDSLAFEEHRIQVLFNEWQLNKKMPQKKFDELENLLRHNDEALVVEFLRRTPTALDTLVPPKFRKYVRDNTGFIPETKSWINDLGWILPIVFLLGTALWLFQPNGKDCVGKTFLYQNQTYCLVTPQDSLIMFETLLCDNMKKLHYKLEDLKNKLEEAAPNKKLDTTKSVYKFFVGQTEIDSSKVYFDEIYLNMLLELVHTNHLDSTSFYKNIGWAYYNTTAQFYNEHKKDSACIFYNKLNTWAWRDSVATAQELEKLKNICTNAIPVIQPNAPIQIPKKIVPTSKPTPIKMPPVVVPPNAPIQQTKQETIPAQKTNAGSELKLPVTHPLNAQQTKQNQPVNLPNALPIKQDTVFKDPFEDKMVYVKGSIFQMGCDDKKDGDCRGDEKPVHAITLSDFSIGKYEVTQKQWKAIMGENNNSSNFKGADLPVEQVSWDDIQVFLQKLNAQSKTKYRLPTEAEWEFAARGGNKSNGYKYSGSNDSNTVAWNYANSGNKTHPVGQKQANELAIYDMSGNVWEWCSDGYDGKYYANSPSQNPTGAASGSYRVNRGGSWSDTPVDCRVMLRRRYTPAYRSDDLGFRVALSSQ